MNTKKKKVLLVIVSVFIIALISIGTYAIWNSELLTGNNSISSGQVKMSYTETNEIGMDNALPMKDSEGKLLTNYFDFQVLSYIKTRANDNTQRKINYSIVLEPITVENPLNDNEIKVYLTMVENGTETVVVEPTTIDKLTDYVLNSKDEIFKNNKGEVITSYRLRAWIDESVDTAETPAEDKEPELAPAEETEKSEEAKESFTSRVADALLEDIILVCKSTRHMLQTSG